MCLKNQYKLTLVFFNFIVRHHVFLKKLARKFFFILFIGLSRSHDFDCGFDGLTMINFLLLPMLHIYYAN
jgi:hypothetical protein